MVWGGTTPWSSHEAMPSSLPAGVGRLKKIDPLMAAFNAIALMSTNRWSRRLSLFII
jgi:hypothetical protein